METSPSRTEMIELAVRAMLGSMMLADIWQVLAAYLKGAETEPGRAERSALPGTPAEIAEVIASSPSADAFLRHAAQVGLIPLAAEPPPNAQPSHAWLAKAGDAMLSARAASAEPVDACSVSWPSLGNVLRICLEQEAPLATVFKGAGVHVLAALALEGESKDDFAELEIALKWEGLWEWPQTRRAFSAAAAQAPHLFAPDLYDV